MSPWRVLPATDGNHLRDAEVRCDIKPKINPLPEGLAVTFICAMRKDLLTSPNEQAWNLDGDKTWSVPLFVRPASGRLSLVLRGNGGQHNDSIKVIFAELSGKGSER